MKRYRGKNANYQRLGSAFVPARKWGKREKKKLARLNEGYTGPSASSSLGPLPYALLAAAMLPEPQPIITSTGTTPFYSDAYEHKYRR